MNKDGKNEVNGKVNSKGAMPLTNAGEIILRLMEASGTSSDGQLATIFRIYRQNISNARGKNKVPSDWILKIGEKYGYSLDWLQYGIEPKKRGERKKDAPELNGALNKVEEDIWQVAEQAAVFNRAERMPYPGLEKAYIEQTKKLTVYMEKRIEDLEKRVEELEKENADLKRRLKEKESPEKKAAAGER